MYTSAVVRLSIFLFEYIHYPDGNRSYSLSVRAMLPFRCTVCSALQPDLPVPPKSELDVLNRNVLCQSKTLVESKFTSMPTGRNNSHGHLFRSRSSSVYYPEKLAWLFIEQRTTRTRTSLALRLIMSLLTESVFLLVLHLPTLWKLLNLSSFILRLRTTFQRSNVSVSKNSVSWPAKRWICRFYFSLTKTCWTILHVEMLKISCSPIPSSGMLHSYLSPGLV